MAAGEQFAILAVLRHKLQSFFDRAGCDVTKISGKHGDLPSAEGARSFDYAQDRLEA